MHRRDFLRLAGLGAAGVLVPVSGSGCESSTGRDAIPAGTASDAGKADSAADDASDPSADGDASAEQPAESGAPGKRIHYFTDFAQPQVHVRTSSGLLIVNMAPESQGLARAEAGVAGESLVFFLGDAATSSEDHPPAGGDYVAPADLDELWIFKGTVLDVDPRTLKIDLIDAHTHPYNRAPDNSIVADSAPLLATEQAQGIALALTMAQGPFDDQKGFVGALVAQHPWLVPLVWIEPATDTAEGVEAMLRDEGFRGLKFHPTLSGYDADGPLMDPFLELARKYKVPVQLHSATDPHATPERVAALAKRFPDVPIVMVHTELGAIDKHHALGVIQGLANVYAETSWTNPQGVLLAMDMLDSSRVMFGTDATVDGLDHFIKKSIADSTGAYTLSIPDVIAQVRGAASPDAFANWARLNAIRLYGLRFKGLGL